MTATLRDRPQGSERPAGIEATVGGSAHGHNTAKPAPAVSDFETLYKAHFNFVWRTLRRLGVSESALDDAAQEVFVVVHRRFADLAPDSSPKAWLYAIAQRVASDQRRTVRRKGNLLPLNTDILARDKNPLESAMQSQANDLVLEFLQGLDPDRRTAFILVELEQMSAPEVARIAAANVNTIYYRIASARKAFASFVEQRAASPVAAGGSAREQNSEPRP